MLKKPSGKRRTQLEAWFFGPEFPKHYSPDGSSPSTRKPNLSGRNRWLMGTRVAFPDTIIAAIADANDCAVVTDNEKDFEAIRCGWRDERGADRTI